MKLACLLLLLGLPLGAQTQNVCGPDASADKEPSLGDVARQHRTAPATHARVTLTEDDLTPTLPIPAIALDNTANDKQIIDAYRVFLQTHTRAEGDKMLHTWYESEVALHDHFRNEIAMLTKLLESDQPGEDPQGDEDDDGSRERDHAQRAELSALRSQQTIERDQEAMRRIEGGLRRLRPVFDPKGSKYDWFNPDLGDQWAQQVTQ